MDILKVENLTYTYPGSDIPALVCDGFSLGEGELCFVCGPTGGGKTTLLRALLPALGGNGKTGGKVYINGAEANVDRIGYVPQDTSVSLTDSVLTELAAATNGLNYSDRAIAEAAGRFGLDNLTERKTDSLSGGERQLLSLAAATVRQPSLLLLDEPTSRLDPIAAASFIDALLRYLRENSAAAIIIEHSTENLFPYANLIIAIRDGKAEFIGTPEESVGFSRENEWLLPYMPTAARLQIALNVECNTISTAAARSALSRFSGKSYVMEKPTEEPAEPLLKLSDLWYRYEKNSDDILCGANLALYYGKIVCLLGGNGAGKSTLLRIAAGLIKPYAGKVRFFGKKIVMLPQDMRSVFLHDTVRRELEGIEYDGLFDFSQLYDRHPYDLSGGEAQMLALCIALSQKPDLLLLDEPSRGLDPSEKARLAAALRNLAEKGTGILVITHDTELVALSADNCELLFNGKLTGTTEVRRFLLENSYYTTVACRIAHGLIDGAVSVEEIAEVCRNEKK